MRVITFSTKFPTTHPRKGQPTFFVEKIWQGMMALPLMVSEICNHDPLLEEHLKNHFTKSFDPKYHTIRAGKRWKEGDWFSPRIWSGKPYHSKQIPISIPLEIKRVWDFEWHGMTQLINGVPINSLLLEDISFNDGLSVQDFKDWFNIHPKGKEGFVGQILSWADEVNYDADIEDLKKHQKKDLDISEPFVT